MSPNPSSSRFFLVRLLHGPQGTGLAISLLLHLVAVVACALFVLSQPRPEAVVSTTIREAEDTSDALGEVLEDPIAIQAAPSNPLATPLPDPDSALLPIPLAADLANQASAPSESDADSGADIAGVVGGFLFQEPENAVKAGRFSAFSRPILREPVGKLKAEFDDPGAEPRAGMPYFIVLQIRVDPKRKTYPVRDLIGSVVGTDGYTQQLPDGLHIADDDGNPVLINLRKQPSVKVTQGTVQLMLLVPGAAARVRDNIFLRSKMLREEQTLQLVFGGLAE